MRQRKKRVSRMAIGVIGVVAVLSGGSARAESVRLVSWNVKDALSEQHVDSRKHDFLEMAQRLKPDVLLLQEVTSYAVVRAIREAMGPAYAGFHIACSDFSQPGPKNDRPLEVGILSRYPLTEVIEFDPSPDNSNWKTQPPELPLQDAPGVSNIGTSRGYLWARIASKKLTVAVVHLKSSWNDNKCRKATRDNARKRERVAAAVALGVLEDMELYAGHSFVVAGDFNVGPLASKNGSDLGVDCCGNGCGSKDRFDETHALLGAGILGGLRMRSLSSDIATTSYPGLPSKSPIDAIYAAGAAADGFTGAKLSSGTFGSDHLATWTDWETPN